MILDDRSAHAATELIEPVVYALIRTRTARAVECLESIQSRPINLDEGAAVIAVSAILRNDFNLRTATVSEFRIVRVRGNPDFLNRLFVGRNDRGSAPVKAVHRDSVNLKAVRFIALPTGERLSLILNLENAGRRAGAAGSGAAGNILRSPAIIVGAVAENARGEPKQLKRIPAKGWKVLHFRGGKSAAKLSCFGINRCGIRGIHYHRGSDLPERQRDVECLDLFSCDRDIFKDIFLEALLFRGNCVAAWRKAGEGVNATRSRSGLLRMIGFRIRQRDGGTLDGRALRIEYDPLQPGAVLRPRRRRK